MAQLEAGRGPIESIEPAPPPRVAGRHGFVVGTDDQALEQRRRRRARAAGTPVRVLGQNRVHLVPRVAVDDSLVLASVGRALVFDVADIGSVVEQLIDDALVERPAALGTVPGGVQLLHQLCGRADLHETPEDAPNERCLGLESVLQDDSWFGFIAAADQGDDWTDPAVWRKANPNFGLSVKEDDLARKAERAIALPGAQNAFRRMHLNEWTEQAERWIDMAAWDGCADPVDPELLRGRPCFGGLDLSTTTDVTALAWVFPPDHNDDLWRVLSRYFVPAENLRKRAERDRVPYDRWSAQGFIEATDGNVVDYAAVEQRIRGDSALFQVREIAYDPWHATHIALRLQEEGAAMVEFRQGFRSMAAPTRELEKLIVSQKLAHGGNPVTRWMAANVAVAQDPAGNLRPAKDKSTERIDGIVALIMAIGRAMLPTEQPRRSVYEDRGLLIL